MNGNKLTFGSLSGILAWSGRNQIRYMGGDEKSPYVLKDKMFHYFSFDGKQFNLVMTCERDLQEKHG